MSDPLSLSCPTCGGTGNCQNPLRYQGTDPCSPRSCNNLCLTCGGTGILDEPAYRWDSTVDYCPDCIEGYPKDRIERAARALLGGEKWWDLNGPLAQFEARQKALAAIRAFHSEGPDHD